MAKTSVVNGRYPLWRVLREGPGGTVFLAEDRARPAAAVVLKALPIEGGDEGTRFYEDIARLTALRHPHLCPVWDFGRIKVVEPSDCGPPGGEPWVAKGDLPPSVSAVRAPRADSLYLSFPFVGGGHLGQRVPRLLATSPARPDLDRWLCGISVQVLQALRFLHDRSLLHFDLKPAHVLFDPHREWAPGIPHVYLIDLGLAARESTPLGTRVRGTFPYIAPEVLKQSMVDTRVDLFSLGATLYHALTNGVQTGGGSAEPSMSSSWPALRDLVSNVPDYWNDCIMKLTQPNPDARYPSAGALIEEIRRRPVCPPPPSFIASQRPSRLVGQEREFDYLARELEKLEVGDAGCSLILITGASGLGKRAVAQGLVGLARLRGIETFQVDCRGDEEAPLDPLLRVFKQICDHMLTPPDVKTELDGLIDALQGGTASGSRRSAHLPPLIDRREDRIRFHSQISDVFCRLKPSESYLILVENLHRAAPELVECLSLITHRLNLYRCPATERWNAPSTGTPTATEPTDKDLDSSTRGKGSACEPRGTEHLPEPRVLFMATLSRDPCDFVAPRRHFSLRALYAEPYVSRIALKPISVAHANELVRSVLGPCHLSPDTLSELHELAGGYSERLLSLVAECQHYDLLQQREHGWVWEGNGGCGGLLARRRSAEWRTLSATSQRTLVLLSNAGDALGWRQLHAILRELDVFDPESVVKQLERFGWITRDFVGDATVIIRSARPIPAEVEIPAEETRRILRARARAVLKRPSENPVPAATLWARAEAWNELEPLLPGCIDTLRRTHSDASLVVLLRTFREGANRPPVPDFLLHEARALFDLDLNAEAWPRLEELLRSDPPPGTKVEGLILAARSKRDAGEFSTGRTFLEEALTLTEEPSLFPAQLEALTEMGRLHLESGFQDKALEWALRADELVRRTEAKAPQLATADDTAAVKSFLARCYDSQNLPEKALTVLEDFLRDKRDLLPATWLSMILNQMARVEYQHARYERALEHWGESLPLERRLRNFHSLANVLSDIGRVHYNRGDQDKASLCFRQSLRIREEHADLYGIATSQNNIGLIYKIQNRLDEAEDCFRRCLRILEELGDSNHQATSLNNLSDIMMAKGDYPLALKYSLRGLEKRKRVNNQPGVAFSYFVIAKIYRTQGELERALDYTRKCLEIREGLGDKLTLGRSLKQLADLHITRGNYYEGFRCLNRSIANFEACGDRMGRHSVLILHALMYRETGLYDEAIEYVNRSLAIARAEHLDFYTGSSLLSRGPVLLEMGALSEAEVDLEEAEACFKRNNSRRELALVLLEKTKLAIELGNRERGLAYLAEAYSHIEQLGLLDSYPVYYRLRGTIAAGGHDGDLALARKLLERGLEEARKLDIPEEIWRILAQLGSVELRGGSPEKALAHLSAAMETIERLVGNLPSQFRKSYRETAARAAVQQERDRVRGDRNDEAARPPEEPTPETGADALELTDPTSPLKSDLVRLQEIALLLSTERNLDALLERIMDVVIDLFRAERGFFILIRGEEHKIRVARNLDREEVERPEFKYSNSIAQEVARSGVTFITNDAQRDERLRGAASVHDMRLQAIVCFPLEWLGERLGVIYLENRFRKRLIEPNRRPTLQAFSSQAAIAIVHARLIQEAGLREEELKRSRARIEELNRRLEVRVQEQTRQLETAREELRRRQDQLEQRYHFQNILGECQQMRDLYRVLERVAPTDLPVLIEGESGTGKELVAHAIHFQGQRRTGPFISENCGALAESLLESELFGHVRGAFTGADRDRPGLFALAEGGTLFLDEVQGLTLGMQQKLLRVLEDGEYRPVGGKEYLRADVRVLSASNQPLLRLVNERQFREDLYYRLNVLRIELPPLRERGRDVLLLARHFLREVVERERFSQKAFSREALQVLAGYSYPGNVRELRNVVEKAAILSSLDIIEPEDFRFDDTDSPASRAPMDLRGVDRGERMEELPFKEAKSEFQRQYLTRLLARNRGVVTRAAAASGMTRESFHRLIRKFEIPRPNGGNE